MTNAGRLGFDSNRKTFYRRIHTSTGVLLCYQVIDDMGVPAKGDTVFHDHNNTAEKRQYINPFHDPKYKEKLLTKIREARLYTSGCEHYEAHELESILEDE